MIVRALRQPLDVAHTDVLQVCQDLADSAHLLSSLVLVRLKTDLIQLLTFNVQKRASITLRAFLGCHKLQIIPFKVPLNLFARCSVCGKQKPRVLYLSYSLSRFKEVLVTDCRKEAWKPEHSHSKTWHCEDESPSWRKTALLLPLFLSRKTAHTLPSSGTCAPSAGRWSKRTRWQMSR